MKGERNHRTIVTEDPTLVLTREELLRLVKAAIEAQPNVLGYFNGEDYPSGASSGDPPPAEMVGINYIQLSMYVVPKGEDPATCRRGMTSGTVQLVVKVES